MKIKAAICLFVALVSTQAYSLDSYQNSALKAKLHNLVKGHTALPYKKVKVLLPNTIDRVNGRLCSAYSPSECVERGGASNGFNLNVEHTWPQSKGAKKAPAVSDMHHLYVVSKRINKKRANLPFCDVDYSYWEHGGSIQGIDFYDTECFEPPQGHKGNVARALFYFSIRYKMAIGEDEEVTLRKWHKEDPVDQRDIERNELIKGYQNNSNPFIDDPSLVNQVYDF